MRKSRTIQVLPLSVSATALGVATVLATLAPTLVRAQAPSVVAPSTANALGVVVRDVRVEGLQRIEPGTVFSYLPIQIGDRVTEQGTAEAVRVLFATGFFKDVRIELDGDVLVIAVEERPAIGIVEVSGSKEFDKEQLIRFLREIGLTEGRTFDSSQLERMQQEIKRQYLGRGKYNVRVVNTVTPLERNRVAIQLSIDEGEDARIKKITINGAKAFRESNLLELFRLSASTWLSWYTKSDQYSRQKLSGDLEALRSFYLNSGFLEFQIDSTQVSLSPNKEEVYITINVNEGEIFKFSEISFSGNLLGRDDEFNKLIVIKVGDIFSNEKVQGLVEAAQNRLGELGYAFATVVPIPEISRDKNVVAFRLTVNPASRVYVRTIDISGNSKTRDEVIRRELRQLESSWYDEHSVRLSRDRLARLGYFSTISVEKAEIPGVADQVDLKVAVVERPLGSLTLGAGFSSAEKALLSAGLNQQNFLGTGTNIATDFSLSKSSQKFAITHLDPYWTDDGVSRFFTLASTSAKPSELITENTYTLDTKSLSMRFGIPYTELDRVFVGASYELTDIGGDRLKWPTDLREEVIRRSSSRYELASVGLGWNRDSRNDAFLPTKGSFTYANVDYATPLGNLQYYSLTSGFQHYHPVSSKVTFATKFDVGVGAGIGDVYPVSKNFQVGGLGSVRGFSFGGIRGKPPVNGVVSALGGSRKFVSNSEILVPLPGAQQDNSIRFLGFVDFGAVWDQSVNVDFSVLRVSVGTGLSWISPLGPLRLIFARAIKKESYDQTQFFQFQIGSTF